MLILSRRVGESIVIGDDIFLTILGFKGNQITLGFDAPDSVIIHRNEIYQKIKTENALLSMTKKHSPSAHNEWINRSDFGVACSNY